MNFRAQGAGFCTWALDTACKIELRWRFQLNRQLHGHGRPATQLCPRHCIRPWDVARNACWNWPPSAHLLHPERVYFTRRPRVL